MKLFGLTVRSPLVRKDTSVPWTGGAWSSLGRVRDWFPGAWQRNMECDPRPQVMSNSTVYACCSRIANDIAKMPPLLKERVGNIWRVVDRPSPFWKVLRKPNNYQTRIQFIVCWLLSLLMTGNTFVLKERDGRGMVTALHILDPLKVKIYFTEAGDVFYRLSRNDLNGVRDEVNVPASEIIHDLINPLFHPLCGVSPLYAAGMAATQANRIQKDSALLFENGGRPSGILTMPGNVEPEKAKAWKEEWNSSFTGDKRGNVAFLGGGMKYETLAMTFEESQMIDLLKWTAEDIARPFGVPLYKINAGPVPVSNNVEALNAQYYSDTLQTRIEAIEVLLDEGLDLPENMAVEFDLDVLLRMDSFTQIEMLAKAVGSAIMTPDEAREKRNLGPVAGGATPYLQEQNFSLAALAKRDAKPDPWASATPPAPVTPLAPAPAEPEKSAAELIGLLTRSLELELA